MTDHCPPMTICYGIPEVFSNLNLKIKQHIRHSIMIMDF